MIMRTKKIIVALDGDNLGKLLSIAKKIEREVYAFKIGYEFFFNFGLDGYMKLNKICHKIFLDLKLHDIPNTVEKGINALKKLNPLMTTIHISGGDEMMLSSIKKRSKVKVLGVSILTSLDSKQTKKYYNKSDIKLLVKQMVRNAKLNKLDGIVCSPKEIKYIRKEVGKKFLIVTPGIRPTNNDLKNDDQKRVLSPEQAIKDGANFLVIGRPIIGSKDPLNTLKEINKSLR